MRVEEQGSNEVVNEMLLDLAESPKLNLDNLFGAKEIRVRAGEPLDIQLGISGTPDPTVEWQKDGVPVGNRVRQRPLPPPQPASVLWQCLLALKCVAVSPACSVQLIAATTTNRQEQHQPSPSPPLPPPPLIVPALKLIVCAIVM